MSRFRPHSITLRGRVAVETEVHQAFPLFSPAGEKSWVPDWDPELLHPAGIEWEEGQIFRTREERGEAVWIVTRLDRARHEVVYHRVEPGRYVARVEVACRPREDHGTEASIAYSFIGLAETGNREIAAMSQRDFDAKMKRWTEWIRRHLTTRDGRAEG